ncbi:hypothetical protein ID866_10194 [Astraeus odoratus]|nr:hypothetical protein ID866_10194 [Astraeus odoratus]
MMSDGQPAYVFSSRHSSTVRRHFHWMALHGVDGAFLQRFASHCDMERSNPGFRRLRDEIGERVREAAEAEGRAFAIMYDVSGVAPDRIQKILEVDWVHLFREQRILDSPNYLREKGKPVVALWGFGFNGRNHTPDLVRSIGAFFRSATPGGVYLMAGGPGHWRLSVGDADRNPDFVRMWTEVFDAISPWTVGRYHDEDAADRWGEERVKGDADYLRKFAEDTGKKVDYIPVVFPGFSGYNLRPGDWKRNDIKRNGGRFLWRQMYNARRAGVRTVYGAMWDEYDEGTALMPVVSTGAQLPVHPDFAFVALDVDGYDLSPDWYMRVTGLAAEGFHGERVLMETFPVKELQNYWSTRPHLEEGDRNGQINRGTEETGRDYKDWGDAGASGATDDAPPPYSLEEIVEQTQAIAISEGQSNRTTTLNPRPLPGSPPPVPARNPSLTASTSATLPSRPSSVSAVATSSNPPSPALPARSQSTRPPGNASRPSTPGRPPPPVNVSSHPRHQSSTEASPQPTPAFLPSTVPHSHFSPEGAMMSMPAARVSSASASTEARVGHHYSAPYSHSRPSTSRPHSPGRPSDALYSSTMASYMATSQSPPPPVRSSSRPAIIDGPHDQYAPPYASPGGWAFPAPIHAAPGEYMYQNQSAPSSMGPHIPYHLGSSPPSKPHSPPLGPVHPGQPGFASPPPTVPPRPPTHPQSSGYYASYAQGSSYGGAYNNHNYNTGGNREGARTVGLAGKALSAVESVAGRDARVQLEKGVKTLANSKSFISLHFCSIENSPFLSAGSSLLNKLK